MRKKSKLTGKIRVQYRNGRWAELTEKQFEALRKVKGFQRLIPVVIIPSGDNPELALANFQQKGGKK